MMLALVVMFAALACGFLLGLAVTAQTSAAVWFLVASMMVLAVVTGLAAGEVCWRLMVRERR